MPTVSCGSQCSTDLHTTVPPPLPPPEAALHLPNTWLHTNGFPHEEGRASAPAKSRGLQGTGTTDSTIRYPIWNQPKQEFPLRDGGARQAAGVSFLASNSEGQKDERTAGG